MLDRERIFSRDITNFTYASIGRLERDGELRGFRFAELQYGHEPSFYDIDISLIDSLGFLGVPETYYGLENDPVVEVQDVGAHTLTDTFVVAYMLKHYLFKNYKTRLNSFFNNNSDIVMVNKSMFFAEENNMRSVTEVTLHYADVDKFYIADRLKPYSLYPQYIDQELSISRGNFNIMLDTSRLGDLITEFGGVYTTQSPGYAFLYFLNNHNSHKTDNFICYCARDFDVLWTGFDHLTPIKDYSDRLTDLKSQLASHHFALT